ncbi:aminotransferase [Reticulibacter mediterranei]|uniref:Aminotransferase n=1 Tax=Reticulibacter mediterranei TaxID=2778369 RepID=A0A8J3IGX2_9CHLR|nr:histidinol-phosphate transaminase [Reticulibacter mediterranei]GHO95294.1 aminotransferase [Reticulibacter mediterranei]
MTDMHKEEPMVVHGAIDYGELAQLGLHPSEILDFSVNSNPYGTSSTVHEAIAQVALDRYPDRACLQLRRAILEYELSGVDLSMSSLLCGNGSSELLWAAARAFLAPDKKAMIVAPTFGEYRAASLATGATISEFRRAETQRFQPDLIELQARIVREKPDVVWLCNPNNPTGVWMEQEQLAQVLQACSNVGTLLIVDESYWRFVTPPVSYTAVTLLQGGINEHLLVLRSLTKDFALAGVRLGYVVGSSGRIGLVQRQLPSWNVSGFAQAAGVAVLADRAHLATTLAALTVEREAFFAALREADLHVLPSRTHFCLINVDDAQHVRQELLKRRLLVRDCTSFGLPRFIRVATRPAHEWRQLVQALQEVVQA